MSHAARSRAQGFAAGEVIAGRYRLDAPIGEGGMAEVYRATDLATGAIVAVKLLLPAIAKNPEAVERFKREGQLLSELDNPAIVGAETFGQLDDGTVFLVMELLEGETLGSRMSRGPMSPEALAPILTGACAGLYAAHARGVIHRDLKPENIFLCPAPDGALQVKLLDFGVSKFFTNDRITKTGEILGTPRYMSPEQLGAEPDVDGRADVYALGVILHEAMTGRSPFVTQTATDLIIAILHGRVEPLRSVRPEISEAVASVVGRAMHVERHERFETPRALGHAYIDAIGGPPPAVRVAKPPKGTQALGDLRGDGKLRLESDLAGPLRLGTFAGDVALARAATAAMGASSGAAVDSQLSPRPTEPVADEAFAVPRAEKRKVMPATRESPAFDPAAYAPASAPHASVAPGPVASSPGRGVPATALMPAQGMPSPASSVAAAPSVHHSHPMGGSVPPSSYGPHSVLAEPAQSSVWVRVGLVIVALLAGALTAAGLLLAYQLWNESRAEGSEVRSESSAPATETEIVGADDEESASDDPAGADEGSSTPSATEDEVAARANDDVEAEGPEATTGRTSKSRRVRRAARDESEPERTGLLQRILGGERASEHATPAESMRGARTALRQGDAARCVQMLDEVIGRGAPAVALRQRADCHEAMGNRNQAIADYRRFCRLVPDHPSISEVRPLLRGWGHDCP